MSGTLGLQTLLDMIGYDTSGLSTQQLDDGFRFMAEFLHPDDAPTLHLCIVNLINTSVAANIMPADFTGIYKGYKGSYKETIYRGRLVRHGRDSQPRCLPLCQ